MRVVERLGGGTSLNYASAMQPHDLYVPTCACVCALKCAVSDLAYVPCRRKTIYMQVANTW